MGKEMLDLAHGNAGQVSVVLDVLVKACQPRGGNGDDPSSKPASSRMKKHARPAGSK